MVIDITGQRFGFLTILEKSDKRDNSKAQFWRVQCDCGNQKEINGAGIRRGVVVSCGCFAKQQRKKATTFHGESNNLTYKSWGNMIQRCTNKKHINYPNYGGRGITVCDSWLNYQNFVADMGQRPNAKMSLDRIDNDKGYSKDNCKWSTQTEQTRNRRLNKTNKSGANGVFYSKRHSKYIVSIYFNGKSHHIGYFKALEMAIKARKDAEHLRNITNDKARAKT
jgi:hypothetical protein